MAERRFRGTGVAVSQGFTGFLCAGVLAFAGAFGVREEHLHGGGALAWRLSWWGVSALCLLLVVTAVRQRLVVDDQGLQVRNAFRTRRLPWSEISGFSVHSMKAGRGRVWRRAAATSSGDRRSDPGRDLDRRSVPDRAAPSDVVDSALHINAFATSLLTTSGSAGLAGPPPRAAGTNPSAS
jgi:hypothetical protein